MKETVEKHTKIWRRVAKVLLAVVIALLLLVVIVPGAVVWILAPERLTPMVAEAGTEYLDAEVKVERVELSFWSTFPRLTVAVDDLSVVSHSLRHVSEEVRATLPQGADTLLTIGRFSGGVNLMALMKGSVALYDVEIHNPRVTIVQADSLMANYDIFPTSDAEEEQGESTFVPQVSIDRFEILRGFPIRYVSVADSIDVTAQVTVTKVTGSELPVYAVSVAGNSTIDVGALKLPTMPFGVNGGIRWSSDAPMAVGFEEFTVAAGDVSVNMNAKLNFADSLVVEAFDMEARETSVAKMIAMLPQSLRESVAGLETDLTATLRAQLTKKYTMTAETMPSVKAELNVAGDKLRYGTLNLSRIAADVAVEFDGENPDNTVIELKKITAKGNAMDFSARGVVRNPLSDARVDGQFDGNLNFSMLPKVLLNKLPFTIEGQLHGKADARVRMSWLAKNQFHKMNINGNVTLRQFKMAMRDSSMTVYSRYAELKLGSSNTVTVNGQRVDSLLTASLKVDTLSFGIPGMTLAGSEMSVGMGTRNVASSTDSTKINPIGANIKARMLSMYSDSDSVRLRFRDAHLGVTLQRYNSDARSPLMKVDADLGSLRFADSYNRFTLRKANATMMLHPKKRPPMSRRMQMAYDSIAALNPGLSSDSIMGLTRRHIRATRVNNAQSEKSDRENIDFNIDNSVASWLRLWQLSGELTAERARLFTPYFPVRNTLSDVDVSFSTDSVVVSDTKFRMGHSDFLINGTICNISRALTSRRGTPLKMDFNVESDSLDINEITLAVMKGATFAEKIAQGEVKIADSDNDEVINASIASQVSDTISTAFVVPSNVEAMLRVKASNVKYSDVMFHRLAGNMEVSDGAIHLNRFGASTQMGSLAMSALYSAPTKHDVRFAGGFLVKKLDLHQFLNMLPEVDSILPMLSSMEGIITADCALTSDIDSLMNFKLNTVDMVLKMSGDSLVLLDNETFRTMAKWLMFKNKKRNMIDSMAVEMMVRDSRLSVYPFVVDMDRYRFGVSGSNDVAMNLNYHVAVLKSPLPFKFGINIKGTPEDMKIRVGKARFNEKEVASSRQISDTVRVNLVNEIQRIFKIGAKNDRRVKLNVADGTSSQQNAAERDTLSASDSLFFIRQGLIDAPKGWVDPDSVKTVDKTEQKKTKKRK